MSLKKTITDILGLLPITKNKTRKSSNVYMNETDTSFTGRTNQSSGYDASTDPTGTNNVDSLKEGKIVINKKI